MLSKLLLRNTSRGGALTVRNYGILTGLSMSYYLSYGQQQRKLKQNECVGIIGYVGEEEQAGKVCLDGL